MSGSIINTEIADSVTLGSAAYPSPLTVTATGVVAPPAGAGDGVFGLYVPGPGLGTVFNDGTISGGAGAAGDAAGGGVLISAKAALTLSGTGTIQAANGFGDSVQAGAGGVGVSLQSGGTLFNGSAITAGNTILGGFGGVGSGLATAKGGNGGDGILLSGGALVENFGVVIAGAGGYGKGAGGEGGIGAYLGNGASLDNEGTVYAGFGGASPTICGIGGIGVAVSDFASLSNDGLIHGGKGQSNGPVASNGGIGLSVRVGGYAANLAGGTVKGGGGGSSTGAGTGGDGVLIGAYYSTGIDGKFTLTGQGSFNNLGTVSGGDGGYGSGGYGGVGGYGLVTTSGVTLTNAGTIFGGNGGTGAIHGSRGGTGVLEFVYGSFTNTGFIEGGHGGTSRYGVGGSGLTVRGIAHTATATNSGTIIGGGGAAEAMGGSGVFLDGGTVTNTGLIIGGTGGQVFGDPAHGNGGGGVNITEGVFTNGGTGTITGGYGVNTAGYGAYIGSTAGFVSTLINAGTVSGGKTQGGGYGPAVVFNSYRGVLEVDAGAVFTGDVLAVSGAGDVLALGGSAAGSISSIGSQFTGFDTLSFLAGASWTAEGSIDGVTGTLEIEGFGPHDTIVLDGFSASSDTYVSGTGLEISDGGAMLTIGIEGVYTTADFTVVVDAAGDTVITTDVLCYLRGTRILTGTGERRVEELRIGDAVVTRRGGLQRIKWIGRQSFAPQFLSRTKHRLPVRIQAGALGGNVPARSLAVSPGHSMLLDGQLVLASALVNGVNITQNLADEGTLIAYYQIELEMHDCIMAEGAWSETFADGPGLRAKYHNAAEFWALYPAHVTPEALALCAPRPERGRQLEAVLRPVMAAAGKGLRTGLLQGSVDEISRTHVAGWAMDTAHREMPVLLEIWLHDRKLASVLACDHRADLLAAGMGNGNAAFSVALPAAIPGALLGDVRVVRAADGADLRQSPACRAALGCTNSLAFRSAARA